jgi:hypothetical protein
MADTCVRCGARVCSPAYLGHTGRGQIFYQPHCDLCNRCFCDQCAPHQMNSSDIQEKLCDECSALTGLRIGSPDYSSQLSDFQRAIKSDQYANGLCTCADCGKKSKLCSTAWCQFCSKLFCDSCLERDVFQVRTGLKSFYQTSKRICRVCRMTHQTFKDHFHQGKKSCSICHEDVFGTHADSMTGIRRCTGCWRQICERCSSTRTEDHRLEVICRDCEAGPSRPSLLGKLFNRLTNW